MELEKLRRTHKITQICVGVGVAVLFTMWKVASSFSPESPYYNFTHSPDFDFLRWFAVASLMPIISGIGCYFILGFQFKRVQKRLEARSAQHDRSEDRPSRKD